MNETGDIIVKMVNASNQSYKTNINIDGAQLGSTAELITLAADSLTAENSFEQPKKYIPQYSTVSAINNNQALEFKPYTISILRLKDKAWKGFSSK